MSSLSSACIEMFRLIFYIFMHQFSAIRGYQNTNDVVCVTFCDLSSLELYLNEFLSCKLCTILMFIITAICACMCNFP